MEHNPPLGPQATYGGYQVSAALLMLKEASAAPQPTAQHVHMHQPTHMHCVHPLIAVTSLARRQGHITTTAMSLHTTTAMSLHPPSRDTTIGCIITTPMTRRLVRMHSKW